MPEKSKSSSSLSMVSRSRRSISGPPALNLGSIRELIFTAVIDSVGMKLRIGLELNFTKGILRFIYLLVPLPFAVQSIMISPSMFFYHSDTRPADGSITIVLLYGRPALPPTACNPPMLSIRLTFYSWYIRVPKYFFGPLSTPYICSQDIGVAIMTQRALCQKFYIHVCWSTSLKNFRSPGEVFTARTLSNLSSN